MKEKYVEERFPRYMEFGTHPDGMVDIASSNRDTLATVSKEHAEKLIADRNKIVQERCDMAVAFDEADPVAFDRFWYGSQINCDRCGARTRSIKNWCTVTQGNHGSIYCPKCAREIGIGL